MSNLVLSIEDELTILGNWTQGRHREDIPLLEKYLFTCRNFYAAAIGGNKSLIELRAADQLDGVLLSDVLKAMGNDAGGGLISNAIYADARANALNLQSDLLKAALLKKDADEAQILNKLLQIRAAIERKESKPAAANLSKQFIKALDEEAAAKTMRYGRGFETLNKRAGSIKRGQLIVLAARPATGKSAAALQIGYNIANTGAKVLFFPLEMTTQETLERLILQQSIVESQEALRAPNKEERAAIIEFLDVIEQNGDFLIYEDVNQLEAIEQTIKEQKPDFVVIDQLSLIRMARKTKDIRERYVEITTQLKHIALEYNTAILLPAQLNRAAEEKSNPTLENLAESDAIGQNADVVLLMSRRDENENIPEGARSIEVKITIEKNRQGKAKQYVMQKFYGNRFKFYDK